MRELGFAIKMMIVTFLVVALMQVRVGGESLENHAHAFVHTSAPVLFLREVAEGGLIAAHDLWMKLSANINTKWWHKYDSEGAAASRRANLAFERSQAYLEDQKEKKERVEAQLKARAQRVREAIGLDEEAEQSSRSSR